MTDIEILIWGSAAGAVSLLALIALIDLLVIRTRAAGHAALHVFGVLLFALIMSDLLSVVFHTMTASNLHVARVLIGPLLGAFANYAQRIWMAAHQRDRLMEVIMRVTALASLAAGPLCLLLPIETQLPMAALISLLNLCEMMWLSARSALLGDRLSGALALATLAMLPSAAVLFGQAQGVIAHSNWMQATSALLGVLGLLVNSGLLWLRNRADWRVMRNKTMLSQLDPVTRVYASVAIVQKVLQAQRRRLYTRSQGAVISLMVFGLDTLERQIGQSGVNEMFIVLAARLQHEVGILNPIGRYYDSCFVAQIDTLHSPKDLRRLGLQVAAEASKPINIRSVNGQTLSVKADIGIGIVHVASGRTGADQILDEAQTLARAAQRMRFRVAIRDPISRRPIALELANPNSHW